MSSSLIQLGICHKTAPLEVRERLVLGREAVPRVLNRLASWGEGAVLSTCGRLELYVYASVQSRVDPVELFAACVDRPRALFGPHLRLRVEHAAVRNLFRVAAGLESQLVGEPHILGQVRGAFEQALAAGSAGPRLSALFRASILTGRRVRAKTPLGQSSASFSRTAVNAVRGLLSESSNPSVLLVGSGHLAHEIAAYLGEIRGAKVWVAGRHRDRTTQLATQLGGLAFSLEAIPAVLAQVDAVIACTTSYTRPLIDEAMVRTAGRPMTIVDLGLPRNVDPSVRGIRGVRLLDLNDLGVSAEPPVATLEAADAIIEEESAKFDRWLTARKQVERERATMEVSIPAEAAA